MAESKEIKAKLDKAPEETPPIPEDVSNEIHALVKDEPEHVKAILTLNAAGFPMRAIARLLKMDVSTVHYHVTRLDPQRCVTLSREARDSIVASLVRGRVADALVRMSSAKLDRLNAKDLMDVVSRGLRVAKELDHGAPQGQKGEPAKLVEVLEG